MVTWTPRLSRFGTSKSTSACGIASQNWDEESFWWWSWRVLGERFAAVRSSSWLIHFYKVRTIVCWPPSDASSIHLRFWKFTSFSWNWVLQNVDKMTYMFEGVQVTRNSSSPSADRRLPIIRPLKVTSTSGPRIIDSAFSRRYCRMSIMPMSKKSKRRAAKDKRSQS